MFSSAPNLKQKSYTLCSNKHTDKKYALSPGPSFLSPLMCFAYGGPQARVSSPRTGCSTLMTSALIQSPPLISNPQHLVTSSASHGFHHTGFVKKLPTRGLRVFACNTALFRGPLAKTKYYKFPHCHTYARQDSGHVQNPNSRQWQCGKIRCYCCETPAKRVVEAIGPDTRAEASRQTS